MTNFEATEAFTKISNAWPAFEPTGMDVHIWTKALKKYAANSINNAIQTYMEKNADRKPVLSKLCDILRTDSPVVRDETMKCNMGAGVFVQCIESGKSGPLVGTFHEVLLYHGKDVPIEHHSYVEAGWHTINKHYANTNSDSKWTVINEATLADMITMRYEMRAAIEPKSTDRRLTK